MAEKLDEQYQQLELDNEQLVQLVQLDKQTVNLDDLVRSLTQVPSD